MKKRIYSLFIFIAFCVLSDDANCLDLSWNTPQVTSKNAASNLGKNLDESKLLVNRTHEILINESELDFALLPLTNLKKTIKKFLFDEDDESKFLDYQTPDKIERSPLSSWMHPSNVPLKSLLQISLLTGCDFVAKNNEKYCFVYYGTKLSGYISQRLFFYSYWWAGHFGGDMDYARTSKLIDSWTQASDDEDKIHLDNITGKITYIGRGNFWSISIGRGKYEIGSNIGGSVILSDNCNDYGYFSSKLNFNKLSISIMHANLIPDSTITKGTKDLPDKYLVIHKIDWKPNSKYHLFWGEHVIYGNRNIEPGYLLPQTLMRAVEHNLHDRDNVLIFIGLNYKPVPKNIVYFNFMIDELKKSEILGDWWGNKYAFQIGNAYTFAGDKETILTLEFTAVRPWMYTHNVMYNKFSHDDISLGFPQGSNLIQYALEFNCMLKKRLNFNIHGSYTRQGSIGNTFYINYDDRPSDTAKWLEGDISNRFQVSPIFTWQPLSHHKLKIGMNISQTDNDNSEEEFMISYQAIY